MAHSLPSVEPVTSFLQSRLPLAEAFQAGYLEANGIFPLDVVGGRLRVAVAGEPAPEVLDALEFDYGASVEILPVALDELKDAIHRTYAAAESVVELIRDLSTEVEASDNNDTTTADARDLANQPPVIRFVNLLIRDAHEARASDIHIESTREGLRTRFRIDGVLADVPSPPKGLQAAVVSRVKLIADLDIAERRAPQDGRVRVRLDERELDLRVSAVPTLYGESLVLRLLDRGGRPVRLDELGMAPETLDRFRKLAAWPHGLLVATGPTGSGKTTTLYAALALRDPKAEKIITLDRNRSLLDSALVLRRELEAGRRTLEQVAAAERARSRHLSLLAALTAALGDSAYLVMLRVGLDGTVRLAGYAPSAARVMADLERVSELREVRLDGPVTKEQGAGSTELDRFAISARRVPQ